MADLKISQLTDGNAAQAADEFVVARSGGNFRIDGSSVAAAATSVGTLSSLTVSGDLTVDTSTLKVDSAGNYVTIGTTTQEYGSRLTVSYSASSANGPIVVDTRAYNTSPGGALWLGGKYNTAGDYRPFAGIAGIKSNTTDGNSSGYLSFQTNNNAADPTERMRLDASGNLGLGVTPSAWGSNPRALELKVAGHGIATLGAADIAVMQNAYFDNTNFKYAGTTGVASSMYRQLDGTHRWYNAASGTAGNNITFAQAMTLDASGNLGLGGTPTTRLDVWGNQRFVAAASTSSTQSTISFRNTSGSGYDTAQIEVKCASQFWANEIIFKNASPLNANTLVENLKITEYGNIIAPSVYTATVGGTNRDVYVDNTGLIGYVSSIRASKIDIEPIADPSWLLALEPVTFHYRKKDEDGAYTDEPDGGREYGLIAEDVEAVNPDLCFYDIVDDEPELRGISYSKLVTPLLALVKQQQTRIEALEARLEALEA